MQHSLSAFATLDQQALERFIHAYGPLAAAGLFRVDDPAGDRRSAAGIFNYLCQRFAVRRTVGRRIVMGQRDGSAPALCFFIARALGREVVEKLTGTRGIAERRWFF